MVADPTTSKRSRGGRASILALLALCALLAALVVPSGASAARGLTTGFADADEFQSASASDRALWMTRTVDAGAGMVRLGVEWPALVTSMKPADPTNPGSISYDFSTLDAAVQEAASHGLKVLLSVNHAPTWAEGANRPASVAPGTWRPNPSDVADFMQAVAARYTGNYTPPTSTSPLPAAQAIEVWDEPNSGDWLNPQFEGKSFTGADLYRDMLNASYTSIKSVNPNVQVVVGGTDPYGDPPGGPYLATGARERPVQFWEHVLCIREVKSKKKKKGKKAKTKLVRDPNCSGKASFDVFAHHPVDNTGAGPLKSGPSRFDASTPDLSRVVNVLRAAEKAGTAQGGARHPVWVTEFWWDSKPPSTVGASLATQARWLQQSLYLFWKAGASVAFNFQIVDSSLRNNVHAGFQSGVYFQDGGPKPSLTAFRFPFVTQRVDRRTLRAWGKAPEGGKLIIQRRRRARWVTVKKLKVSKGAVFLTKLRSSGTKPLRARVVRPRDGSSRTPTSPATSLPWRPGH